MKVEGQWWEQSLNVFGSETELTLEFREVLDSRLTKICSYKVKLRMMA